MNVAYFCEPQIGGTFTFFKSLSPALAKRGIRFRCVSPIDAARFKGSRFEGAEGVDFLELPDDPAGATARLIEHLEREHFDLAMVLPAADIVSSNLPPYLPRTIRCAIRVPMMTRGAYAPAAAIASHVNRVFAVSDRIRDDLVRRYRLPPDRVEVIYHGVDPSPYDGVQRAPYSEGPLRALFVGRLWDIDKGIFLLPPILKRLKADGIDVRLKVVGEGADRAELRRRFEVAGVMDRVTMTGALPLAKTVECYREADIFVFPSRFEGCGFAVLEAMAAGCAPVVADIRGSLRVIVDNGRCGVMARPGDAADFARKIRELVCDHGLLQRIQQAARRRVLERFTLDQMADRYAESFRRMLSEPDLRPSAIPLGNYRIPKAMRPTWRTRIPRPIKNWLRAHLESLGIST